MSSTISYSSGKEPESDDSLVQRSRQWVATVDSLPTKEWIKGYVLDGINYVEDLADALEEREREVERLREAASLLLATIPYEEAQTEEEAAALKCLAETVGEREEGDE